MLYFQLCVPACLMTQQRQTMYSQLPSLSTLHSTNHPRAKSTVKKQDKYMKMKELLFQLNKDNCIEFLESILEKHSHTQYKDLSWTSIGSHSSLPWRRWRGMHVFNYYSLLLDYTFFSPHRADLMDVNNESDYKKMVWKICDAAASDSMLATTIFINMKHIEKLLSHQVNAQSRNEDSSISDDIQVFHFVLWLKHILMWSSTTTSYPNQLRTIWMHALLDGVRCW